MGLKLADAHEDSIEIWPGHEKVFELFIGLSTQWRVTSSGRRIGLDYSAIDTVINWMGLTVSDKKEFFNKLRIMEYAAISMLNERV